MKDQMELEKEKYAEKVKKEKSEIEIKYSDQKYQSKIQKDEQQK